MKQAKLFLFLGGIAIVLGAMVMVKYACNRAGYWPNRVEARVYEGTAEWPVGDMRKCEALPREDGSIYFLGCVDGAEYFNDERMVTVTFWGRTERPDRFRALHSNAMEAWIWRCKKDDSSLTCYAVN